MQWGRASRGGAEAESKRRTSRARFRRAAEHGCRGSGLETYGARRGSSRWVALRQRLRKVTLKPLANAVIVPPTSSRKETMVSCNTRESVFFKSSVPKCGSPTCSRNDTVPRPYINRLCHRYRSAGEGGVVLLAVKTAIFDKDFTGAIAADDYASGGTNLGRCSRRVRGSRAGLFVSGSSFTPKLAVAGNRNRDDSRSGRKPVRQGLFYAPKAA